VVVTHELASIFAIGNNSVFLDAESRSMIASGDPKELLAHSTDHRVRTFLTRGSDDAADSARSHG
jgi:phospholipid/cholesterol/gamma-HCH transport system ATP-binding protein